MKNVILFILAYCFITQITAQDISSIYTFTENDQTYSLKDWMAKKQVNGLSISIYHSGGIDTTLNFGQRDREAQLPINDQTLYQVGGMTRPLVHFAVLRLAQAGTIELDAPANDYLQSWKIPQTPFSKDRPVTVRDLLLQTRGFNLGSKPKGFERGAERPSFQQILNGEAPAQNKAVKLKKDRNKNGNSTYANGLILQLLLEDVHQRSIKEILQSEVLTPLRMDNSYLEVELNEEQAANFAIGYTTEGERVAGDYLRFPEIGCAGLWTTTQDYLRFVSHIIRAARGEDNRFIAQPLAIEAVTPNEHRRGLIFYKNRDLYWGGANLGYYTTFEGNVEDGWVKVMFCNSHLNWRFMNTIMPKTFDLLKARMLKK